LDLGENNRGRGDYRGVGVNKKGGGIYNNMLVSSIYLSVGYIFYYQAIV
jgi:hypothetical protein